MDAVGIEPTLLRVGPLLPGAIQFSKCYELHPSDKAASSQVNSLVLVFHANVFACGAWPAGYDSIFKRKLIKTILNTSE